MNTNRPTGFTGRLMLSALLLAGCWSCQRPERPGLTLVEFGGQTMGTTYTVKVAGTREDLNSRALAIEVGEVLRLVERTMSTYQTDSEIMRFNSTPSTEWITISRPLWEVLQQSLHWSFRTGGAFDLTAGPLINLWGFGPAGGSCRIPSETAIEVERQRVGYRLLEIRSYPPAIRKKRPELFIDLSAIGKGYAVDRVFESLRRAGVKHCLVEIGGELRGLGQNPRGLPWTVAVEQPTTSGRVSRHRIGLSPGAVATSGDYRNFFLLDGKRYSHILDPRSGRPLQNNLVAVTVIDSTATGADALATALMVLGPKEGYEFAVREGVAALFSFRRGDRLLERTTPGFESSRIEE